MGTESPVSAFVGILEIFSGVEANRSHSPNVVRGTRKRPKDPGSMAAAGRIRLEVIIFIFEAEAERRIAPRSDPSNSSDTFPVSRPTHEAPAP